MVRLCFDSRSSKLKVQVPSVPLVSPRCMSSKNWATTHSAPNSGGLNAHTGRARTQSKENPSKLMRFRICTLTPTTNEKRQQALQSEERILSLAAGSLPRKTPDFGDRPPGMPAELFCPLGTRTRPAARHVPRRPRRPGAARAVTCGVSARSRGAQGRGRAEAAAQARPDWRAPGALAGPAAALASLPLPRPAPPREPSQRATVTQ